MSNHQADQAEQDNHRSYSGPDGNCLTVYPAKGTISMYESDQTDRVTLALSVEQFDALTHDAIGVIGMLECKQPVKLERAGITVTLQPDKTTVHIDKDEKTIVTSLRNLEFFAKGADNGYFESTIRLAAAA